MRTPAYSWYKIPYNTLGMEYHTVLLVTDAIPDSSSFIWGKLGEDRVTHVYPFALGACQMPLLIAVIQPGFSSQNTYPYTTYPFGSQLILEVKRVRLPCFSDRYFLEFLSD